MLGCLLLGGLAACGRIAAQPPEPARAEPGPRPWATVDQSTADENEPGDRFGAALSSGDFNNDGFEDLAVGAPGETLENGAASGSVYVFSGSETGLTFSAGLTQQDLDSDEDGDRLGAALVSADLDGDRFDDLAVGAPGESLGNAAGAGAVYYFRGAAASLRGVLRLTRQGTNESGGRFGSALAAGDFVGDGKLDLAVGAPGESIADAADAGAVYVFSGDSADLALIQRLDQQDLDANESGDQLGAALAAGDFNGDGRGDLAVGAPGEALAASGPNTGSVYLFRSEFVQPGDSRMLRAWTHRSRPAATSGDRFGDALASADFDGDGVDDLATGAPFGRVSGHDRSGVVQLYRGDANEPIAIAEIDGDPFAPTPPVTGAGYGSSVAAGDLTGDGLADLAVGAPGDPPASDPGDPDPPRSGTVFTFKGFQGSVLAPCRAVHQES